MYSDQYEIVKGRWINQNTDPQALHREFFICTENFV